MTIEREVTERIKAMFPTAVVAVDPYPTGATAFDVRVGNALFVLEHYPTGTFSLYRVTGEEPFNSGSRPTFLSLDEALDSLGQLIKVLHEEAGAGIAA